MTKETSQFEDNPGHMRLSANDTSMTTLETGPLDLERPWVIEFQVSGTSTTTLQARIVDSMVIGRSDSAMGFMPEVDLSPFQAFERGVSRKHALVLIRDQRLMVTDLYSTNGTRLNNVLCKPGETYRLRHGNELMVGKLRLQVSLTIASALTDTQTAAQVDMKIVPPAMSGNGREVLVVEDDTDVGNVYRTALEYADYKVTLVNDATKALGAIYQKMPDVIILDLMLPDMNGLDFVRYVRKQKTQRHISLVVVSGVVSRFQMNQVLAAGADVFLNKPLTVVELLQAVRNTAEARVSGPGITTIFSNGSSSP